MSKPMNLTIKRVGDHVVLCDTSGEPLPCQTKVVITTTPGNTEVVVTFRLDGDSIRLAETDPADQPVGPKFRLRGE